MRLKKVLVRPTVHFWFLTLWLGFILERTHANFAANNIFLRIIQGVPAYVVNRVLMNFEDEFSTAVRAFFPDNIVPLDSAFELNFYRHFDLPPYKVIKLPIYAFDAHYSPKTKGPPRHNAPAASIMR